ncbi:MAG: hypothetical protein AABY53_03315 [Bdellovibrionota bacterium]
MTAKLIAALSIILIFSAFAFAEVGDHIDWKDSEEVATTQVVFKGMKGNSRTYSLYPMKNGKVSEIANRYNGKDVLKETDLKEALSLEIDREKAVSEIKAGKSRSIKSKAEDAFDEMENGLSDEDSSRINNFIKELREL